MAGVHNIELGLKIRVYVLRWLTVVSDCIGALVENDTRPARHKQYTHRGIAYAHLTAPHSCDYMGYIRHVGHAAWSRKGHLWLLELEYAKFSLYEKWNNCPHPLPDCHRLMDWTPSTAGEYTLAVTIEFHGRDISYKIHSLIHTYKHNIRKKRSSQPSGESADHSLSKAISRLPLLVWYHS